MLFVLVVGFWATRSHAKDRVAAGQGIVVQCQVDYFVVQQLDLYGLVDNLSSSTPLIRLTGVGLSSIRGNAWFKSLAPRNAAKLRRCLERDFTEGPSKRLDVDREVRAVASAVLSMY